MSTKKTSKKTSKKTTAPSASTTASAAVAEDTTSAVAPVAENVPEKLTQLTVPQLQARYLEVVGRPTGSSNSAYLVWKIREARKGRVPVGPRRSAKRDGVTFKILPLRMDATVVDKLDEAWKRQGLHSRMDLFRKSLHNYLTSVGEKDVAALLADAATGKQ